MRRRSARVQWLRHRRLIIGLTVGLIALVAVAGGSRVSALTSSRGADAAEPVTVNLEGTVGLFDPDVVHAIEIEYDKDDYARMLDSFRENRTKDFIEARLTIDGTRIDSVGLRLKGNSSLSGLRRPGPMGIPRAGERPPGVRVMIPDGRFGNGVFPGGRAFGGPSGGSADEPERLPWLIEFDQFVKGQRYEGYETLAVRSTGGVAPQTALNEALSLRLVAAAGEPASKAAYATFAVNGQKAVLRLLVEEPGRPFVEDHFGHDGVLYKALHTGGFKYEGEDPAAYDESFDQITRKKEQDLQPLIDLMRWTTNASDAQFAAGLDEHLDVDSFARYVALQELLVNFDDMSGPGRNYYLWYDLETTKFTVITWDLNLALARGPRPSLRPSPAGVDRGRGFAPRFGGRVVGRGPGGHLLKERFLQTPRFRQLYLDTYEKLGGDLYRSGLAAEELDSLERVLRKAKGIDAAAVSSEVDAMRSVVEELASAPASPVG